MNVETFFGKFKALAEAPGAVARMRQIILELAVSARLVNTGGEWPKRPLKELATKIGSGATPHGGRENYAATGVPLIRSMNVHFRGFEPKGLVYLSEAQADDLSNAVVQPDDVLLNITGASIGRVTTAPRAMSGARVNQHVTIIRPTKELLPKFLSLFLASPSVQWMINEIEVGATRQALTKGMIEQFEIPLPPLAEQKRIVAKVDELMALCDRLEAQQAEREARHTPLARAALARFAETPTPANLEYLFHPAYDVAPAELRQSILSLAVQGLLVEQRSSEGSVKQSEPPIAGRFAVPRTWAWTRFEDVGEQRLGKMLDRGSNKGSLKPYLRNTNVQWMRFALEDVKQIALADDELEEFRLRPGDLLICEGGEPGRCAIWRDPKREMYFQKAIHRVRPRPDILSEYLAINLRVDATNGVLDRYFTGATIKHFTGRSLREYTIPIPPLAEQRRIVAKVNELTALVDQLEAQHAAAHDTGERLMKAIVAELTAAG